MSKISTTLLLFCSTLIGTIPSPLMAANPPGLSTNAFPAFTGKVIRNKVRIRLEPSMESMILKEIANGDMVVVTGETDEFYAILPPEETKAYIFRTFVLDDIVEGHKVNVRLSPSLESPVIAQLNTGDRVNGSVSTSNAKWLEITPPNHVRFYIAKDYIEKIGPPDLMAKIEKRKQEACSTFSQTTLALQTELQKPFENMHVDHLFQSLNQMAKEYTDLPDVSAQAKDFLKHSQEIYLHKKVAYLENKTQDHSQNWQAKHYELTSELEEKQNKLAQLEKELAAKAQAQQSHVATPTTPPKAKTPSLQWASIEQQRFEEWIAKRGGEGTFDEFYEEQEVNHTVLTGIIEPYSRPVKNKPGDFVLINQVTHLPIAYLYTTIGSIQDKIGQPVTIHASPRPNHHFAYPAYYILSFE
ncbi:SH3 domain-containing protein [Parachlamydia acanthamoebae]|nr:SH3 domain-containing protein [Parachlamydia acanthamoebae]